MPIFNGDANNNVIFGGTLADIINGLGGDDTLVGGGGGDGIDGGIGNDFISGDAGDDFLTGAGNNDVILGGEGSDTVDGGDGDDILDGGAGDDSGGEAGLFGGNGNDQIYANSGIDVVNGGANDDVYFLHGDGLGSVTVNDASGIDTFNFSLAGSGVNIDLSAGLNAGLSDGRAIGIANGAIIENVVGGAFSDQIFGNSVANTLTGGEDNDRLVGGLGNDIINADFGNDLAYGDTFESGLAVYNAPADTNPIRQIAVTTISASEGTSARIRVDLQVVTPANDVNGDVPSTSYTLTVQVNGAPRNFIVNGATQASLFAIETNLAEEPLVTAQSFDVIVLGLDPNANDDVAVVIDASVQNSFGATQFEQQLSALTFTDTNYLGGADTLDGGANGAGASQLYGGLGNDTYVIRDVLDQVLENETEGTDLIQSEITYTLPFAVENLTLLTAADIDGSGNELANRIAGNSGNNLLDGFGGTDTLIGNGGADTYIVDRATDIVTEVLDAAIDTVISNAANYTLAANVEVLFLGGGSGDNFNGTGNALDNQIFGDNGRNILNGGLGNDAMFGAFGNDTYIVTEAGDTVNESDDPVFGGIDTVQSARDFTLGAFVENLTLTGAAIAGTGNTLNNALKGNANANTLSGGTGNDTLDGGTGVDTLNGGAGNDTYVVDTATDVIVDASGVDTIQSSIFFSLVPYAMIENLTLTGTAVDGLGNTLNNVITGNTVNNALSGGNGNDTLFGGSGQDSLFGGADNDILDGGAGDDTMTGGVGNDVYVVDSLFDAINEVPGEGTADRVETTISLSLATIMADIENLTLMGTQNLNGTGNDAANVIKGNSGANILDGGLGVDRLEGGAGNDTYRIEVGEVVVELLGAGVDTVESQVSYVLASNVENLKLMGVSNLNGSGNGLDNTITGNAGNNILNGLAGADRLIGGTGNDTYIVDNALDVIVEGITGGVDTAQTSVDYTIGLYVENLTLLGANAINGTGNALNNTITGNSASNTLDGGVGNDFLNGGAGADIMIGGLGNDVFVIDNGGDDVQDIGGVDRIETAFNLVGLLDSDVENVTFTGAAAVGGIGNTLNNVMIGNGAANNLLGFDGNDTLDGRGGGDTMDGGDGNDVFIVDSALDTVVDSSGTADRIESSLSVLALTVGIENLTLLGAALIGTGNASANVIKGNALNNTLDGLGGVDRMEGGNGNDLYRVDVTGDVVVELNGEGTNDRVESSATYTLSNFVESLTLIGAANINGTGNALDNVIIGNAGNNVIDSGLGADTVTGGLGLDSFRFSQLPGAPDQITDFSHDDDTFVISAAAFGGGLAAGDVVTIQIDENVVPDAVGPGGQFLIFEFGNEIWWDENGDGADGRTLVAVLTGTAAFTVTETDFLVIA